MIEKLLLTRVLGGRNLYLLPKVNRRSYLSTFQAIRQLAGGLLKVAEKGDQGGTLSIITPGH